MSKISAELKHTIITRPMPPNNESVAQVARETGLDESTLYGWKRKAKIFGVSASMNTKSNERWSTQNKFQIVVETASLSEIELTEYCRNKGLYMERVEAWRNACAQVNGGVAGEAKRLQRQLREKKREIKGLQKNLRQKETALAETAALLVLRKNAHAILGGTARTYDQCLGPQKGC